MHSNLSPDVLLLVKNLRLGKKILPIDLFNENLTYSPVNAVNEPLIESELSSRDYFEDATCDQDFRCENIGIGHIFWEYANLQNLKCDRNHDTSINVADTCASPLLPFDNCIKLGSGNSDRDSRETYAVRARGRENASRRKADDTSVSEIVGMATKGHVLSAEFGQPKPLSDEAANKLVAKAINTAIEGWPPIPAHVRILAHGILLSIGWHAHEGASHAY